jgi:hypothetical protein
MKMQQARPASHTCTRPREACNQIEMLILAAKLHCKKHKRKRKGATDNVCAHTKDRLSGPILEKRFDKGLN